MDVECTVCSPTGPDVKLGSKTLIQKTGIIGLLNYWYQVSRHFKNNDYDAVWLQNPFIILGNPFSHCLVTMHSTYYGSSTHGVGNLPFHLYKSLVAHVERFCLTRMHPTTCFTGVAQTVCEELENIGISRDRITYIPNGANTTKFHPSMDRKLLRNKFEIPEDDIVLLSVGRLTAAKQPFTLIELFSHLEKKLENVTLCIAGKGELFEATKEFAQRKELGKVLFLGHIDHDQDLPDLYACADYYIMTSNYEGTPLTLMEAMASGLPSIVSDIPNLKVVIDTNCGINFNFKNIEESANKIIDYLNNDHRDHSINARKFAENNLDWKIIAEEYLRGFYEVNHEDHVDLI